MPIYKVDVKATWIESHYIEANSPEEATAKALEDDHMMLHSEMLGSEHYATNVAETIPDNYHSYLD